MALAHYVVLQAVQIDGTLYVPDDELDLERRRAFYLVMAGHLAEDGVANPGLPAPPPQEPLVSDGRNWTLKKTVAAGATTNPTYVSPQARITVAVSPAVGATARVEVTLAPRAEVVAGTAVWRRWSRGDVTEEASDSVVSPLTALRCVAIGGAVVFEVSADRGA